MLRISHSRMFQLRHTHCWHIYNGRCTDEHTQAWAPGNAHRDIDPRTGGWNNAFLCGSSKAHVSKAIRVHKLPAKEGEKIKDSPWQLPLSEIWGETERNKIGNEMTGFFYLTENVWKPLVWLLPIHHLPQLVQTLSAGPFFMFTRKKIFLERSCPCQVSSEKHFMSWIGFRSPRSTAFSSPSPRGLFQHAPVPRTFPLSSSYFLHGLHVARAVLMPSKSPHSRTFNNQQQPIP